MNRTNSILLAVVVGTTTVAVSNANEPAKVNPRDGSEARAVGHESWRRLGTLDRASKVIGATLVDSGGEKLGKVKDLAIDLERGEVLEVIVATGGVLGVGEKLTGVPPELVSVHDKGYAVSADADKLKGAPVVDLDKWVDGTSRASLEARERYFNGATVGQGPAAERYRRPTDQNAPAATWRVERGSKLLGHAVTSGTGDKVGKVEDLVVDLASGRVLEVVVSTGGFLGIGDELSAVPPSLFRYGTEHGTLVLQASKETVQSAPRFKAEDWSKHASPDRVGEVYRAYGVKPTFDVGTEADNSKRNVRDRRDSAVTPLDQGNNEPDLKTTAEIRRAVVREDGLSVTAQNVKIITLNGRVKLRGPVANAREKEIVEGIAQRVAGVDRVDSELEVDGQEK